MFITFPSHCIKKVYVSIWCCAIPIKTHKNATFFLYVCIHWMNHEFDLAQEFCLFLCMILCLGFVSQPNILVLCLGCVQLQAASKVMQSSWLCEVNTKIQQTKMLVTCQRFGDLFLSRLIWQYSNHKTYM